MSSVVMAKENSLKQLRIEEGLSQTELANLSGVSVKTLGRIELRTRSVAPRTLYKVLKGLNKNPHKNKAYDFDEVFPGH